jgi:hypothetical protein
MLRVGYTMCLNILHFIRFVICFLPFRSHVTRENLDIKLSTGVFTLNADKAAQDVAFWKLARRKTPQNSQ